MPHYHRLGAIPPKRHTQFSKPDGGLYSEELVSTEGFSNNYSLIYHAHPPTAAKEYKDSFSVAPKIDDEALLTDHVMTSSPLYADT